MPETYIAKTIQDNPRDRIQIELGDSKRPDTFYPQLKIMRWDNEVNASFRLIDDEPKTLTTKGEKIKLIGTTKEVHFYDITPCEEYPEGGYEFEVVLKEKPATNKIEFTLETKGLDFFYQVPIAELINTNDKKWEGCAITETDIFNKGGKSIFHRPENVNGSYSVYHNGNPINYVGRKLYQNGGFGAIYRPKIIDSAENWAWGELNIDQQKGLLTVTIPQNFLDKAIYPVKIDPTFGYSAGTSASQIDPLYAGKYTLSVDALTAESISFITSLTTAHTSSIKGAIYKDSDKTLVGSTDAITEDINAYATHTMNFSGTKPSLVAGDYWLAIATDDDKDPYQRLSTSGGSSRYEMTNQYPNFIGTLTGGSTLTWNYNIYCTYEEAAATSIKKVAGVAQASIKKMSGVALASIKKIAGVSNVS